MSGSSLIGLEAFIVLALVLGFGGWELYSLRRDRRREARRDAAAKPCNSAGDDTGDKPRADPPAPR